MFSYGTRQLTSKIILVLEDLSLGAEFAVQKLINYGCQTLAGGTQYPQCLTSGGETR